MRQVRVYVDRCCDGVLAWQSRGAFGGLKVISTQVEGSESL